MPRPRHRGRRVLALLLAMGLPSCSSEYGNPFADVNRTLPLPAGARLTFSTASWSTRVGSPREVYTADAQGGGLARLTFCNSETRRCDSTEATAFADRRRLAVRRGTDVNGDGRVSPLDGEGLLVIDLTRGLEAALLPPNAQVSGVDWSPSSDLLVFSSLVNGAEDIFRITGTGQDSLNLTASPTLRERRPRIDPTGTVAVFERIDTTATPPKGQIWIFRNSRDQIRVTMGGDGTAPQPDTPYVVGSDADPDYSPDGGTIVFRRLRALGASGSLGEWDIMAVRTDGSGLRTIATGPAYRGAPDWGREGIVFNEIDTTSSRLILVNGDGGERRTLVTLGRGFDISNPRWLP
jgi:hypothetical protein